MRTVLIGASALLAVMGLSLAAGAQAQGQADSGPPLLAEKIASGNGLNPNLRVTSPVFTSGGVLDDKYTQNGENMSPPLHWSHGPAGTRSFVILAEDAGVQRHDPIVHWVVYNIPSTQWDLDSAIPANAAVEHGIMQGKNVRGAAGYVGPKPPAGQTHPYHFEVFALNSTLDLDPANADRNAVVNAMKSHVLAKGEIVANYTGK